MIGGSDPRSLIRRRSLDRRLSPRRIQFADRSDGPFANDGSLLEDPLFGQPSQANQIPTPSAPTTVRPRTKRMFGPDGVMTF